MCQLLQDTQSVTWSSSHSTYLAGPINCFSALWAPSWRLSSYLGNTCSNVLLLGWLTSYNRSIHRTEWSQSVEGFSSEFLCIILLTLHDAAFNQISTVKVSPLSSRHQSEMSEILIARLDYYNPNKTIKIVWWPLVQSNTLDWHLIHHFYLFIASITSLPRLWNIYKIHFLSTISTTL